MLVLQISVCLVKESPVPLTFAKDIFESALFAVISNVL